MARGDRGIEYTPLALIEAGWRNTLATNYEPNVGVRTVTEV